jgi:hypothetical protein
MKLKLDFYVLLNLFVMQNKWEEKKRAYIK